MPDINDLLAEVDTLLVQDIATDAVAEAEQGLADAPDPLDRMESELINSVHRAIMDMLHEEAPSIVTALLAAHPEVVALTAAFMMQLDLNRPEYYEALVDAIERRANMVEDGTYPEKEGFEHRNSKGETLRQMLIRCVTKMCDNTELPPERGQEDILGELKAVAEQPVDEDGTPLTPAGGDTVYALPGGKRMQWDTSLKAWVETEE